MKTILTFVLVLGSLSIFAGDGLEERVNKLEEQVKSLQSLYVLNTEIPDAYMELLEKYELRNADWSEAPEKRDLVVISQCFEAVKKSKHAEKLSKLREVALHNSRFDNASIDVDKRHIVFFRNTTKQSCYEEIITKL